MQTTLPLLFEVHYNHRHQPALKTAPAEYFRSAEYLDKLHTIEFDTEELVRLSIGFMSNVALDYRQYTTADDVFKNMENDWECLVNLQFFHISSPLKVFRLDIRSQAAAQLRQAVQENLNSRMSTAARAFERQRLKQSARYKRIAALARPAYMAVYTAGADELKRTPEYLYNTVNARINAQAEEARDRVYIPLREKHDRRLGFLLNQAVSPGYSTGFDEMLTAFATEFIFEHNQAFMV